jgi:hypothetical protein
VVHDSVNLVRVLLGTARAASKFGVAQPA